MENGSTNCVKYALVEGARYGKQEYEFAKGENAGTENTSTNLLRGWKHKYEKMKHVYYEFPLACLTLN